MDRVYKYKIVTTLIPTEDKLNKFYNYLCDMQTRYEMIPNAHVRQLTVSL